jgi:dTDP-4-dehydrorhamnose 3,5-epimerase
VLRGLHYQLRRPQGKLVTVVSGEVFDVAVDIRRGSPTFGRWVSTVLRGDEPRFLWIPVGFAHGFCVLSDLADVIYKQSGYYDAELERAIAWNDPDIAIDWSLPAEELTISERDRRAPLLREIADELPFEWHP